MTFKLKIVLKFSYVAYSDEQFKILYKKTINSSIEKLNKTAKNVVSSLKKISFTKF